MPTDQEALELERELAAHLELVNSDPEHEGGQATAGDQALPALVGLTVPAAGSRPMRLPARRSVCSACGWDRSLDHGVAR